MSRLASLKAPRQLGLNSSTSSSSSSPSTKVNATKPPPSPGEASNDEEGQDSIQNSNSKNKSKQTNKQQQKCPSCGCTSIDVDPSRAEAVCTNCGDVLESNLIVADVQFEENAHGGSSAIGQFVSGDVRGGGIAGGGGGGGMMGRQGGAGMYGNIAGIGRESREITLRNARNKIRALATQLNLRQDRIDIAFNFFRMALSRNLTRGRKSTHVIAACVYITCRTEGTSHMLIDFSDILQIDVYELGRTYLRLSQELCINIPAMDPCLYVMRFAHKLEFGEKTHEVSMTALRLVSRMKKDWIHFGRRPSGLCGAALLIASRLHTYNRSVEDVIKVVKVHESTLRKRLTEFGETPASQLTLDEFMNVDLDAMTEEQDPPSFKAARKKDKERLNQLEEECDFEEEISELQSEIERQLAERRAKIKGPYAKCAKLESQIVPLGSPSSLASATSDVESRDADHFIAEETLSTINEIVNTDKDSELMPPPPSSIKKGVIASPGLGLKDTIQEYITPSPSSSTKKEELPFDSSSHSNHQGQEEDDGDCEIDLTDIDDDEINGYIMSEDEIKFKTKIWMRVNAEYLKAKAEKDEKERLEEELAIKEGREIKKKKKPATKKQKTNMGGNQTAIEAIEKIVQEKKISTKINYEVLKSLNLPFDSSQKEFVDVKNTPEKATAETTALEETESEEIAEPPPAKKSKKNLIKEKEPIIESGPIETAILPSADETFALAEEEDEDLEEDLEDESHLSAAELLSKHRGEGGGGFEDGYYGEEEYF